METLGLKPIIYTFDSATQRIIYCMSPDVSEMGWSAQYAADRKPMAKLYAICLFYECTCKMMPEDVSYFLLKEK